MSHGHRDTGEEKPSVATTGRSLWDVTRGQRARYASAIGALAAASLCILLPPLFVRWTVDGVLGDPALPASLERIGAGVGLSPVETLLATAAFGVVATTSLAGVLQYLRGRWAALASEGIARTLRERLFAHLERLPCSYHDRADTGDLVQRCSSDVETVRVFLSGQVVEIGRAAFLFLAAVPLSLHLCPGLAVASFALYPLIVGFAVVFFRRIKRLFLAMDEAEGELTTVLQENLTGIRVVRAFARQDFERSKFAEKNGAFRDRTRELITTLGTYWAISDVLCLLQLGVVLLAGAWWTTRGSLSLGDLNAFLMVQALVIWPMRQLGRILADSGKASVALGRIREILGEEPEPAGGAELGPLAGDLHFEDVSFSYAGEGEGGPALDGVSLHARPGDVLALLGPPGSGKSTVVHLLLRLYDHDGGSIRLDGRDVRDLDPRALRHAVGTVLQEPFLYSKTIRANLALGFPEADDERLVHAASTASVHEAIEGFTEGYDTLVGERGVTLSGGQRQRVALARALLKDPAVLVLDDALSAVDTRTEAAILAALDERRGRRTTVLITHRLGAAARADRICVLEGGRVVQSGTHATLAAEEGVYRRLWRVQHALEDELQADLATTVAHEPPARRALQEETS